jgi:hypothetical protein
VVVRRLSGLGQLRLSACDMRSGLSVAGDASGVCPTYNRCNLSLPYWSGSLELLDRVVSFPVHVLQMRLQGIHVAAHAVIHLVRGLMEVGLVIQPAG